MEPDGLFLHFFTFTFSLPKIHRYCYWLLHLFQTSNVPALRNIAACFAHTNRGDQSLAHSQASVPLAHQPKLRLEACSSEKKLAAQSPLPITSELANHSSVKP